MDRERWSSYPAATEEERALLAVLNGTAVRRTLPVVSSRGDERSVDATLAVEAAEPFDGKAEVVVRLVFHGPAPADGERLAEDPWDLLDAFLREAEGEARRRASARR